MLRLKSLLQIILLFIIPLSYSSAQISINTDGSLPDSSAMVDISSTERGMLIPRMSTGDRAAINAPATGLMVYDTDTDSFWYYDEDQWKEIGTKNLPEFEDPTLVSGIGFGNENRFMVLDGEVLYAADETTSKLRAIDVSDAANPTIIGEVDYSNTGTHSTNGIAIKDNYVYIPFFIGPGSGGGIVVIDISDPTAMTYNNLSDANYSYSNAYRAGDILYLIDNLAGELVLYDISNAANPVLLNAIAGFPYRPGDYQGALYVENNLVYLIHHESTSSTAGRLSTVEVSDPQNPSILSTIVSPLFSPTTDIDNLILKKYQNFLFLCESLGNERGDIIDISDPSNPLFIGKMMHNNTTYATAFDMASNYLYTLNYGASPSTMVVQDLTVPTNHQLVYSQTIPTTQYGFEAMSVIADKDKVYFLLTDGLFIYQSGSEYVEVSYPDGSTSLEPAYDNLGDHLASENINTNGFYISNGGENKGIHLSKDGQVAISENGAVADSSAILDLSSTDKGILIPRMTNTEREAIAHPADGLLVYDTDKGSFWYFENNQWKGIAADLQVRYEDGNINMTDSFPTAMPDVQNLVNISNSLGVNGTAWQSFTPTLSGELTAVDFTFASYNNEHFDGGTLKIYKGQGTSGALLSTSAIPSYSSGLQNIVLTGPYPSLQKDSLYTFAITDTVNTFWSMSYKTLNPYSGGRNDRQSSWDYIFQTYMLVDTEQTFSPFSVSWDPSANANFTIQSLDTLYFANGTYQVSGLPDHGGMTEQMLVTNAAGNIAWQTLVEDTDDQKINEFSLSGNSLRLTLENDAQGQQTVDLTSFKDNTDDQKINDFSLSGNSLRLTLENDVQGQQAVDLSSFKDNTDDQKINEFSLSGNSLRLTLENDAQGQQTVDLSSFKDNTDQQKIDVLNLNGTTLEISLQNDGENTKTLDLSALVPIGTIQMWPTSTPPSGWLICNGASFSSSTYPDLAVVLGSTNVPNFNGRFPLGVGNSGTSGSTQHNLSSTGGEEKHTLTVGEMPSHSHGAGTLATNEPYLSQNGSGTQDKRDGGGTKLYEYDTITGNTASVGGNQAHNNLPPFYTINFIIKAR